MLAFSHNSCTEMDPIIPAEITIIIMTVEIKHWWYQKISLWLITGIVLSMTWFFFSSKILVWKIISFILYQGVSISRSITSANVHTPPYVRLPWKRCLDVHRGFPIRFNRPSRSHFWQVYVLYVGQNSVVVYNEVIPRYLFEYFLMPFAHFLDVNEP